VNTRSLSRAGLTLVLLVVAGAGVAAATPDRPVEAALQDAIDRMAAGDQKIPGVELTVYSPRLHIDWSGASGHSAIGGAQRLESDQPFRIASVTKSFVSAVILRLAEQDRLAVSDPIENYISADTAALLRSGGYDPKAILIQHLMTHRSGLVDHTDSPVFNERMTSGGQYHWTRREQVALAMTLKGPLNPPGGAFHYSDTGYVILGEIVERVAGRPLAQAVREQLSFKRLGLNTTWFEGQEPEPRNHMPRAHQYFAAEPDVDATDFDPSFDLYGGGGLVSTTQDLARFFRALLRGEIFAQPQTLAAGLAVPGPKLGDPAQPPVPAYAPLMATMAVGRHVCWGKGGFWGTVAIYCPDIDVAIAVTANRGPSGTTAKVVAEVAVELDAALSRSPTQPQRSER
jgi:D-alanyl-D-alanine carboxypeptidase